MRRMNEYVCPTLRGSKDLLCLADLQHAHMDFSYAGEPNSLNARACIIHIRPVANITVFPEQPLRYSLVGRHCRDSHPRSLEIALPQFGVVALPYDFVD